MLLENFINEKTWKEFIGGFIGNEKLFRTLYAAEDIWPFLMHAFLRAVKLPLLVVTSTFERARALEKELESLSGDYKIFKFFSLGNGIFFRNRSIEVENLKKRLEVLKYLCQIQSQPHEDLKPFIILATSSALLNLMNASTVNRKTWLYMKVGEEYKRDHIISELINSGYERVKQVYDRGEFSVKGEVIDIFDITEDKPFRIDFWGDEAEGIFTYDPVHQESLKKLQEISIFPNINPWKIEKCAVSGIVVTAGAATETARVADKMNEKMSHISFTDFVKEKIPGLSAILCDPIEIYLKTKSDIDILLRTFERDEKDLITGNKEFASGYLAEKDFLENEDFYHRLDLVSTISSGDTQKSKCFNFSSVDRQKKSYGNVLNFLQNIKNDLKGKKSVILCISSPGRRKKIEEIFLDNSISFKYLANNPEKMIQSVNNPDKKDSDKPCEAEAINFEDLEDGIAFIYSHSLYRGYVSSKVSVYGELDIYDQVEKEIEESKLINAGEFEYFKPGEYIVHKNHGIGKYIDLISRQVNGVKREYFLIEYANNDKLYIPTWQADRLHRYVGSKNPVITALDSRHWENLKTRVRKSVKKLAVDLAYLYARREESAGFAFDKDSPWQKEVEDLFPFKETPGQLRAINQVKQAMEKDVPMDILVIGDVGFGKTEVAIRAAFKAIDSGKQVLMLVPTTILADQHFRTFSLRYVRYPITVEVLSRFRSGKKQKEIVEAFNSGKVDLLIGTHRILQKDIKPMNLGLVIVDEEQRFGVNSKEKIKLLKTEVDVLTLSATPIPRTLYMSLSGIKNIAQIETHPQGRNPIETFMGEIDYRIARMAIEREIARGGQSYYVYNRISGIESKMAQLKQLMPEARIALTHGRMDGAAIEKVMNDFIQKKYDILLTTSIIESGMDIENVNTLIVENSHMFGLSQLYQLRGRVGRSSEKAYAYFFYPSHRSLGFAAFQRLKTLTEYTDLGSGYNIALRDLEIRGAGEILGARQHGHIDIVGFDMYCQIIREEIEKLKGHIVPEDINVQIEIPVSAYLPRNYINNERERINIYRKLGEAKSMADIGQLSNDMEKKYGKFPEIVINLVCIAKIKYLLKNAGIEKLSFSHSRGIMVKKIEMPERKIKQLSANYKNLRFDNINKQLTIKNIDKNINLDLVIKQLSDIICFM